MDDLLNELNQYLFPSVPTDCLINEPYKMYTEKYRSLSGDFTFFRGFISPDPIKRAKIYRAINLCSRDNFITFSSASGLIIKYKTLSGDGFKDDFNFYLSQPDYYAFIPKECDQLDDYNFVYYRGLMTIFQRNERIPGEILRLSEHSSVFLFISLNEDCVCKQGICQCHEVSSTGNAYLEKKWKEYLQEGVSRSLILSSSELSLAFKIFPWKDRCVFKIIDNKIEMTVKSTSLDNFDKQINLLREGSQEEFRYVELDFIIADIYEAFGIYKILCKETNLTNIIPLIGTSRIYYQGDIDPLEILNQYEPPECPNEGTEIFSQDDFAKMSKYQKASLVKVPSGHFYYLIDLYLNINKKDPYTRQDYSEEFKNSLKELFRNLEGAFMFGFPPIYPEPQLITVQSDETISLYIKLGEDIAFFWQIPDLRGTEFELLTLNALQLIVIKWTDKSLFSSHIGKIENGIHSIFSPYALYVFEKSYLEGKENLEKQKLAERLREKLYILQKCT